MFKLPELGYSYDSLEPFIDVKTMEIHYSKHHQAYVDNLNKALIDLPEFQNKEVSDLLSNLNILPEKIRTAVKNNAGGHFNHSLFWKILKKDGPTTPNGQLLAKINENFIDFEKFKHMFKQEALKVFGSGWVWLTAFENGGVDILSTPNQDYPEQTYHDSFNKVILGLDVWEHAYYLKYQNKRADYVDSFWNVVNWEQVEKNYEEANSK